MHIGRWMTPGVRRASLAALLVAVVLFPGAALRMSARHCRGDCPSDGRVLWTSALPGSWIAEGTAGTVAAAGQAHAAIGHGVAVVGFGLTVDAMDASTGFPRWTATLSGLPAGAEVASVRVFPAVVAVGVQMPAAGSVPASPGPARGAGAGRGIAAASSAPWEEVVLNAVTGETIRRYPAAAYGGAVSASLSRTVIVGPSSVTSYANATGKLVWRDPIGSAGQAWQVDGGYVYVTVSVGGQLGTAPVTAVRQIDMRDGAERLIQPSGGPFSGQFSGVAYGVLLFTDASGLNIYSATSGRLITRRPGAVPAGIDPVRQVLYIDVGGSLVGIDPATGLDEPQTRVTSPQGTYGIRAGVALGLDPGASGAVWGYSIARRRVIWTTRSLPWPHYFVSPSGIGGSEDPASGAVLLATCAKTGRQISVSAPAGGPAFSCLRPALVEISR